MGRPGQSLSTPPGPMQLTTASLLPPPSSARVRQPPPLCRGGAEAQGGEAGGPGGWRAGTDGTVTRPLPRRPGWRPHTHLVAQLLGLLLQHGVPFLVPADVLLVPKALHVFQFLMGNFQLLLVVVVLFNFGFKVLKLFLE